MSCIAQLLGAPWHHLSLHPGKSSEQLRRCVAQANWRRQGIPPYAVPEEVPTTRQVMPCVDTTHAPYSRDGDIHAAVASLDMVKTAGFEASLF
jgi:hypothetical protein